MATKKATEAPVTIDGASLHILPTPHQIKLATLENIRREMARVYRGARTGETDTADASRLIYMLTSISKMIEIGELEQRITLLEERRRGNT
ncbi:MAG: hypothetical protein ACLQHK_06640 [Gallionellaceae bacterium]